MGNTESNVTSGVKKQAGVSTQRLYKLVDLKGGGMLVDMMKRACQSKQYAEIDHAIKTKVSVNICEIRKTDTHYKSLSITAYTGRTIFVQ